VSCARCHQPEAAFRDGRSYPAATSLGASWTGRHAPTLLNAAFKTALFWDGRKDSLWSQALAPIESEVEHNFGRVGVAQLIARHYRADYEAVFGPLPADFGDLTRFPDGIGAPARGRPGTQTAGALDFDELSAADQDAVNRVFVHFGKAIAAYEVRLVSLDAPLDRFLQGDAAALSMEATTGLKLFVGKAGCSRCHTGPLLSDEAFHNLGVPQDGDHVPREDEGRHGVRARLESDAFNGAGRYSDDPARGAERLRALLGEPATPELGAFRTPSLRNVARTAPYFHNGYKESLLGVVTLYDEGGGRPGPFQGEKDEKLEPLLLTADEQDALVALLRAIDGVDAAP
jgi:cytochrome c peroxidase